jgi:UDP-N-acetylglucosamine:LPS N-acetylglucosamine transferase
VKKVLILTAGFGDGHNTAARNIADALELTSSEVKVETLDLFQSHLGLLNNVLKKTYLGLARYAPSVWNGIYSMMDNRRFDSVMTVRGLKSALEQVLQETNPDCVVSTYPVYAHAIQEIYKDHSERPFRFITVITDSISVNSSWFRAPSDFYCVANDETSQVLRDHGVAAGKIKAVGFPVNPIFAEMDFSASLTSNPSAPLKLLYLINTGRKKTGKGMDRLLEIPDVELTIAAGRDAELREKLLKRAAKHGDRVKILGWTNQMPRLMATHHLVITKAGGATVQEAIAARCPMIINQMIPGQEEGNARLVEQLDVGQIAEKNKDVARAVSKAFAKDAKIWRQWKKNLARLGKPDASVRIAELILAECDRDDRPRKKSKASPNHLAPSAPKLSADRAEPRMLLCDFHIHSNYSDGKMTVPEVVDFYGSRNFDCICITDHLGDPRRLIGKFSKLLKLTLGPGQMDEYFDILERERRRAWRKYGMLVMTGIEFNKDGFTPKSSAHLLGIDLKTPINPALDLPETIAEIHAQGGLAVASHPHVMKSEWGKNTLHLWENQEKFAPMIDAWEIANRNNIFTPVGLKRLPFLANSDFHKPKHIHSWKTLLNCAKNPDSIKECIRRNERVAITLYRDNQPVANDDSDHADGNGLHFEAPALHHGRPVESDSARME